MYANRCGVDETYGSISIRNALIVGSLESLLFELLPVPHAATATVPPARARNARRLIGLGRMALFSRDGGDVSDRVGFLCNGVAVSVDADPDVSLLSALREQLGLTSVKDGCAPQGQCGCCTVLVDGAARVACVTPVARVADREVTTVEGLPDAERDALAGAFVNTGGSQCGFCTPGIIMRAAALRAAGKEGTRAIDQALAAHLCRCTGWQTIREAIAGEAAHDAGRDLGAASRRAELEGGVAQDVGAAIPVGGGGFADDTPPAESLVAVPRPPGSDADSVQAAGLSWVVDDTLDAARRRARKVQGRRTTAAVQPALPLPDVPPSGVRLATSWTEPAYLEPDASWCVPGGDPASPLGNGGAFGGKAHTRAGAAARELADRHGRAVRVVFSREDVVRIGPKRPVFAASGVLDGNTVRLRGACPVPMPPVPVPYRLGVDAQWQIAGARGPAVSADFRGFGLAEQTLLVEAVLDEAGVDRSAIVEDACAGVLLATCAFADSGARAGAHVAIDATDGALGQVDIRVAAGDVLDAVTLRSYAIGAAHMALGWVLTEGIAVDPETGEVQDLTIRSFGVLRPRATPPIRVRIVPDDGPPLARSSDAVFAAVAAATWNALAVAEGSRPETFPASSTRTARMLRR
jgi:aerobic-type carbon monoxide dehydrogenase small subunit (CoxS/CutS family)